MREAGRETISFNSPSTIFVTDSNAPVTFPPHWHNAAEFTVTVKDDCNYRVNDVSYKLDKGDILLVWPHQIHETVKTPSEGAVFIQFPSAILENNLDLVSVSAFLFKYHHISLKENPELAGFIADKLFEIQRIYKSSDLLSETKCKLCIYEILLKLSEEVLRIKQNGSELEKSFGNSWNYIRSACSYIVENSSDNLSQGEVAAQVGLSTFYFSKLFKQYMHMSFPAYLSNIRVKHAASLLLDEELTITECAFNAGFQSTTAFNKAFHEITGYSPRDYRKLYRK